MSLNCSPNFIQRQRMERNRITSVIQTILGRTIMVACIDLTRSPGAVEFYRIDPPRVVVTAVVAEVPTYSIVASFI